MLTIIPPQRQSDSWAASSGFQAPRGDHKHKGIDLACWPGSLILSTVSGEVTKLGYPYGDDLSFRYVEVTDYSNKRHRFFYVEPLVEYDDIVIFNEVIGESQDLRPRYPDIIPHLHYEILNMDNGPIDPTEYID